MPLLYEELTSAVISAFYEVYNELGKGFLEKVYENAMDVALCEKNIMFERQKGIQIYFRGKLVGEYYADLLINNQLLVEIKAVRKIIPEHEAQLINYLKATRIKVGLLINFGEQAEFKRLMV